MSIWNCEKDDNTISSLELKTPELQIKFLSSKEIGSDIISAIKSKIGYNTSTTSKNGNNQNSLDLDNIVEVIDSLGNTNYTFRLKVNDDDTATFYNLIVNESITSTEPSIYVHKFVSNDDTLQAFIESGYNLDAFVGKIQKYSLSNFLASNPNYSITNKGEVDDCICGEITLPTYSGSGTGGTAGGAGTGSGS